MAAAGVVALERMIDRLLNWLLGWDEFDRQVGLLDKHVRGLVAERDRDADTIRMLLEQAEPDTLQEE